MAISLSIVLLLGIAVWLLYRYAGLKFWHAIICMLFGFFLATTTAAPAIRHMIRSILAAIPGQH